MILHYLKMAFRSLGKYRMQNIISIVSLAVALFCFSINMYLTRSLLEIDNWVDDQVVYLKTKTKDFSYYDVRYNMIKEVHSQRPEIEAVSWFRTVSMGWNKADGQSLVNYDYFVFTDTALLDVLDLELVAGNWQSVCRTNAEHCVVLAESFARKQFGSADSAIGQEMYIQELGTVTIQAVLKDLPYANSITDFQYSAGWLLSKDEKFYKNLGLAWAKLKEGVDPDEFCENMLRYNVFESVDSEGNTKTEVSQFVDHSTGGIIVATRTSPGKSDLGFFRTSLLLLLISLPGILILVVALFNYFHLLVNSILSGRREYALRRVHGARTVDMWKMVSVQIILTTILTGILSLIIARYVTPLITVTNSTGNASGGVTEFFMATDVIVKHTLQYILMLIAAGLLIAWFAVIRIKRAEMSDMIKRNYGGRNFMLGVQLTVAQLTVTLLVAMFLKMKSNLTEPYSWLSIQDKKCIITDKIFGSMTDLAPEVEYLKSYPYITHVTTMFREYLSRDNTLITEYTTGGYDDKMNCNRVIISPEVLDMFEVGLKAGRMPQKSNEILVDDHFIERFGLNIGDTIRVQDLTRNYPDIGSVFIYNSESDWIPLVITGHIDNLFEKTDFRNIMAEYDQPVIYCNWKVLNGFVVVRCLPGHEKETRAAITGYHNPDYDVERDGIDYIMTPSLYDLLDENNTVWNSIGFIAWIVAIIAFIITLLGVYSAISIDTTRRRKEMAVRKINGARTGRITMLFVNLYVKLFIISSAVSIPLSAFLIRTMIMNNKSYEKGAGYAILFYMCIVLIMVVFVGLTIGFKIHRIARENPADVVKSE